VTSGVVVVGGANMDFKATSLAPIVPATSNPGTTGLTPGGVGRNIAENIARLGGDVHLVSVVGHDALGDELLRHTALAGVDITHVCREDVPTGTYTAVLDRGGELVVAIADMAAADMITPAVVAEAVELIAGADLIVLDGNLAAETVLGVLALAARSGVRVMLDPVSVPKSQRLAAVVRDLWCVTPNRAELSALTGLDTTADADVQKAIDALHDRGVETVWVRLGADGSVLSDKSGLHHLSVPSVDVVDVTGAGDAMLGAFCCALLRGKDAVAAARYGHAAAAVTIASADTVRGDLSDHMIRSLLEGEPA
jgi:pseudouridine kinase